MSSGEEFDGIYFLENAETRRYVFQAGVPVVCDHEESRSGEPIKCTRGNEGGCNESSGRVVGADANYYNRAYWKIIPQGGGKYFIENLQTKRYLLQDGQPIKGNHGDECGWKANSGFESPKTVGADANYFNLAHWHILPQGNDNYFIENVETKRYLFQDGDPMTAKRGAEGGWTNSPSLVGADANYYNRAYFKIIKHK